MNDAFSLQPCFREEADARIILNISYFASKGMTRKIVKTTDMDVVVPAVDHPQKVPATQIWVPFGVWKNFNYIPAHKNAPQLGPRPASALQTFHALTGYSVTPCPSLPAKERTGLGQFGKRT